MRQVRRTNGASGALELQSINQIYSYCLEQKPILSRYSLYSLVILYTLWLFSLLSGYSLYSILSGYSLYSILSGYSLYSLLSGYSLLTSFWLLKQYATISYRTKFYSIVCHCYLNIKLTMGSTTYILQEFSMVRLFGQDLSLELF